MIPKVLQKRDVKRKDTPQKAKCFSGRIFMDKKTYKLIQNLFDNT